MEKKTDDQLRADLELLRPRLQAWRASRRPGSPMPEDLWMEAVSLARKHDPFVVARCLPVDYGALKRRLSPSDGPEAKASVRPADFIELRPAPSKIPPEAPGLVVELVEADGARMVIRLPGTGAVDVASLVGAFRRRGT